MANKVKGLKKINRTVNNFTRQFGVRAKLHTEFQAICDDMIIGYALTVDEDEQQFFIEDAHKRYPDIQADIMLWCLMHEIGHCMTDKMWTKEELEYFWYQKDHCAYVEEDQLRNDWYHATPDEFFATRWAGEYMRKHPKKVAKFWNKLQKELIKFYQKNNLIED